MTSNFTILQTSSPNLSSSTAMTNISTWLIPVTIVEPGNSAAMGNDSMFYLVHFAALFNIVLSLVASGLVLAHVMDIPVPRAMSKWTRGLFRTYGEPHRLTDYDKAEGGKPDFSSRFAMYLALADFTWSIAHSSDHLYLTIGGVFPDRETSRALALIVWVFFGYHNLMHACLSLYTYLRVVKNKRIELGAGDWRLQAVCFGSVLLFVPIFLSLDGFGALGYWCLSNARTTGGAILSFVIFGVALLNAFATAGSNFFIATKLEAAMRSIRKLETRQSAAGTVLRKTNRQDGGESGSSGGYGANSAVGSVDAGGNSQTNSATGSSSSSAWQQAVQEQRTLVASQCLTTLIRTASLVYIPLSIATFSVAVLQTAGYIEPLSSLAVVITANVSGFANSWAYMKNSMLKQSVKMISPPASTGRHHRETRSLSYHASTKVHEAQQGGY